MDKKISRKTFLFYVGTFIGAFALSKLFSGAHAVKTALASRATSKPGSYGNSAYGGTTNA